MADLTIPLQAGPEKSVAATKSCIASMAAGLALLADWSRDRALGDAVAALPNALRAAVAADWWEMVAPFVAARSALIIGRGIGYPVAMEAALKLKETASLHAEPYSAAEVLHGPIQIVQPGFPVLLFRQRDAAGDSPTIAPRGWRMPARVSSSRGRMPARRASRTCRSRPRPSGGRAAVGDGDVLREVDRIARARGFDPDTPPLLKKVTETL